MKSRCLRFHARIAVCDLVMESFVSVLIPTQGRVPQLRRLLDSLAHMEDHERIPHEIIVANNARDEGPASRRPFLFSSPFQDLFLLPDAASAPTNR